jgi:hypothetical protein
VRWAGHAAHTGSMRNTSITLLGRLVVDRMIILKRMLKEWCEDVDFIGLRVEYSDGLL